MTIDTIKDVLGRIISINKNLTAESLRNLLTASGWDMHDIDEGLKVFKDFNYAGERPLAPVAAPVVLMQKPVDVTPKVMVEVGEISKLEVFKNISQNIQNQQPIAQQIDNSMMQRQVQTVSLDPLPPKTITPQVAPTYQPVQLYQSVPVKIVENSPPIIVTEHSDNPKEWGIISLDIVLFLIVLGLLIYILIR